MTRTIYVGVDGSSPSHCAVKWSAVRAEATGADLVLIHILTEECATLGAALLCEITTISRALLALEIGFATSFAPSVKIDSMVLSGDPMIELGRISRDASLVVVGTHKTGFLHGQAFGSRGLQLAAFANSTVAVIPEGYQGNGHGVLAGVDDSPAGRSAVQFAAKEAERTGQELILVRARKLPDLRVDPLGVLLAADVLLHAASERIMLDAVQSAHETSPTIVVRCRSIRRAPSEALIEASRSATLLIVGNSHGDTPTRPALGSIGYDVLLNLTIPTLIVHTHDDDDDDRREFTAHHGV